MTTTAVLDEAKLPPAGLRYNRSPFQVALLMVATLGTYFIFWLARARYVTAARAREKPFPWWFYLGLLVPILNLFLLFGSLNYLERHVRNSGVRLRLPFWVSGIAFVALSALWRLSDPYWLVSLLSTFPIVIMHTALSAAESSDRVLLNLNKLTVFEWIIVILGLLFVGLGCLGLAMDSAASAPFVLLLLLVLVGLLAITWLVTRQATPMVVSATIANIAGNGNHGFGPTLDTFATRPDRKTIWLWIGSVRGEGGKRKLHEFRKRLQAELLGRILQQGLPTSSAVTQDTAYLLVHFLSGRATLDSFQMLLNDVMDPATRKAASAAFNEATSSGSMSPTIEECAAMLCSVEITNETLEDHYEDAMKLANFGVATYPKTAEMFRQRGVLRMVEGDYQGAISDLDHAARLRPNLLWLNEPLARAQLLALGENPRMRETK